jgi:hypothetical protein
VVFKFLLLLPCEFVHAYNQQSNMDNPDLDVFADTEESIALLNAAIEGDESI